MPVEPIPIATGLYKNIDEKSLKVGNAEMQNCYVDEQGNIHRRPGMVEIADLGESSPVDGLVWWPEEEIAIAVTNRKTFKITDVGGTNTQLTNDTFQKLERVNWDNWGSSLYGANGAKIQGVSTSTVTEMADGDAPVTVSHAAIIDRYLLANEVGTGKFHRSDVNDPTAWSGDSDVAESESDDIMALGASDSYIWPLGARTMEMWRNDGATPFVKEFVIQSGTLAKHSLVWIDGTWKWLDQNRQMVMVVDRTAKVTSLAINDYLQGFNAVTDCMADFILFRGRPFAVFTFPSEEKTLVYDLLNTFWYEWSWRDPRDGEYKRWRVNCSCLAESWGTTLVGDRVTSKVYKLDPDTYQDDGDTIRTLIRTAHIDWGTLSRKKRSNALFFNFKGKNVIAGTTYQLMVNWRNNGEDAWRGERLIALHSAGGNILRGRINRMGSYYTRQYEFSFTDNAELILMSVEEDFDYMSQ